VLDQLANYPTNKLANSKVWLALALVAIAGALIVLPLTSAVVVIGGALAVIALLRWHELALYALIFAVPFGSWFPIPISVGNLTAVDLLVTLVIALWLARMIVYERGIAIELPPLSPAFAIFLFVALLSVTGALSLQHAAKEFTKWLEMFAVYVYVANNLDATKMRRALVAMFLAGLVEAAIGVYQFWFRVGPEQFELFGRFMRAYGTFEQPNPYAGYLALIIPIALGIVVAVNRQPSTVNRQPSIVNRQPSTVNRQPSIVNRQPSTVNRQPSIVNRQPSTVNRQPSTVNSQPSTVNRQPSTVNRQPSTVNRQQLTVSSKTESTSLFTVRCSLITDYWLLITGCLALAAMLAALLMSWSRGAWMGVAAALVITVVVQSRRAFVVSLVIALVLVFIIMLSSLNIIPEAIAARFSGIGDYFGVFDVRGVKVDDANFAVVQRMAFWQTAWAMFSAHPLLGIGLGNYAVMYPAYALPFWGEPLGHAHNYYLNVAAEAGLAGLAAYAILWAAAFWRGWRAVRVSHGMWRSVAAGLLGTLVALSIHNGFDNLFVHGMAVQVGIGLGMVEVIQNSKFIIRNSQDAIRNTKYVKRET
jgi:hypothetical protein